MDVTKLRREIILNEPHQVTVSGSFIHFETDMVAPVIIQGTGNITVCGKNMFNFDPNNIIILKSNSGTQRWGYVVMPCLSQITLSATLKSEPFTGNFNINTIRHYDLNENGSTTYIFINNEGIVTDRTWPVTGEPSYISLLSSYASSGDAAKTATTNKILAYNIQCEYGATATTFEAYNGTTAFAGTARKSLRGVNNIWSDDGSNITVTYWTH